ncbi:tetratricopeptide repeat protein [Stenomitos frigidus]|uniref:tetratricopeptide repeat protein n=1 Tax=Stenomitos frigidus TaxID=1886765 RepID=UPI003BB75F2E
MAYSDKQDYDKATTDHTQALKLKPDYAESHLWRGVIYSQRGEKQKAVDDLKAALKGLDDPKLKQRAEEELRKLK